MDRDTACEYRKTTWNDVSDKSVQIEEREYGRTGLMPVANGRSYFYADCPFCETQLRVYPWSLAGGGKRCYCGALLASGGVAIKRLPKEKRDA